MWHAVSRSRAATASGEWPQWHTRGPSMSPGSSKKVRSRVKSAEQGREGEEWGENSGISREGSRPGREWCWYHHQYLNPLPGLDPQTQVHLDLCQLYIAGAGPSRPGWATWAYTRAYTKGTNVTLPHGGLYLKEVFMAQNSPTGCSIHPIDAAASAHRQLGLSCQRSGRIQQFFLALEG